MIEAAAQHLEQIKTTLRRHLPRCEVRAFGSRVTGKTKPYSDLDLVLIGPNKIPTNILSALKEELEESDVPFRVDLLDWHTLTPTFQTVIDRTSELWLERL